jgi:phosphate transport system substrate-binding protein
MGDREIAPKSPLALIGGSIGYSFRYYLADLVANDGVKMLSLNGVYPSRENIRSGAYPVVAEFYAVYRADNQNPNVTALIDWLLSTEGQALIESCGYVPLLR